MKVAILLDGVMCDTDSLKDEWFSRLGDMKFLQDAAFWVALRPYEGVSDAIKCLSKHDLYVFAERPKSAFLPTRAWLRNNCGLSLNKDRLIVPSLNRYDCRINGIDVFVCLAGPEVENMKTETVRPVTTYGVGEGATLLDVAELIDEDFCD